MQIFQSFQILSLSNLSTEGIFSSGHVADHRADVADDCGKKENSAKHVEADIKVSETGMKLTNISFKLTQY